jgi:beta-phosphoglucomutase-like phosphatase (HAD superfamily)
VLVVFDCDGVLVDSEVLSNAVLARMLSEAGLATSMLESRRRYQGMLLRDIRADAQERLGHPLPDGWVERYERERDDAFSTSLRPIEGARDLVLRCLGGGIDVCVASQGSLEKTERSLTLTGLMDLFAPQARFSAGQVARGKPHPDLFLHAARALGVAAEDCVVIEDTPSGVTAGVRAGMRVLGYAADADAEALTAAGAEVVIHSLAEAWPLLRRGPDGLTVS